MGSAGTAWDMRCCLVLLGKLGALGAVWCCCVSLEHEELFGGCWESLGYEMLIDRVWQD